MRCGKIDVLGHPCCLVEGHPPSCTGTQAGIDWVGSVAPAMVWCTPDGIYYQGQKISEDPQMSDFKVGDVVRVTVPGTWEGVTGRVEKINRNMYTVTHDPQFGHLVCMFEGQGRSRWMASGLELVSRPSEAKPPAPAFKVGDRVRVREYPEVVGIVEQVRVHGTYPISIRCMSGKYKGETDCYNAIALELLPPEPAKAKCGKPTWPFTYPCALAQNHGGKCLDGARAQEASRESKAGSIYDNAVKHGQPTFEVPPELAAYGAKYVKEARELLYGEDPGQDEKRAAKPMTATAASILERNTFEPLLPTADQMEYLRNKLMRDIINSMALPREMLEEHTHKIEAPANGWMPAGTYMPMPVTDVKPFRYPKPQLKPQVMRNGLFLEKCPRDGDLSGIAAKIPLKPLGHQRLQTSSWNPMDDTFLEDE